MMKPTRYILLISLVAACGGLLFGFDTAVISGVLPLLKAHFGFDELTSGWIVSILTIGCIIGVIFAGSLADKYGRKKLLYIASLLFLLSALGTASSANIYIFQFFRFLGGLAVGMASMASPMYISEIAPADKRGRMVSINQLTIVTGILFAFFTNYLLVNTGDNNWRWMLLVMAIPAFVFFVLLFTVPRSPRWLLMVGKDEEGLATLKKITGEANAAREFEEIRNSLNKQKEKATLKDIFSSKSRTTLIVGIILAIFQQITGINIIMYYAPVIFDTLGFSIDSSLFQTVLIGCINFLFTIISLFFVDRLGRKPLLLIGSALMTISLGVLAFSINEMMEGYWILLCILVYIASFAGSLGPVTWVLISEIFPNKYRAIGMSVSTLFLWVAAFFVSLLFPVILSSLGIANTFLLFMIVCIAAFLFYLFFVKETKNTKLESIE
ncbi:MAG: D-xylose-proton symporter [Candidatus Ordinivivax streblomastigis]|uniref:D-xylose-proton symporter n=1 Tax=Candidatus Ordinivivax streblomastigis TaxID=2540710 RepID=A0A5M8NYJ1_9BACT|nr:MAG: D-xylose-proton symporter [Candidatus Ordinivivax streblomastigis]